MLSHSHASKRSIWSLSWARGKVSFVPHGIDTEYFKPLDETTEKKRLRCLFAGAHLRDFANLPQVIDGILGSRDDVDFIIVSRDKRCGSIPQGERVKWLRDVPDDEYLRIMQEADVLVLPLEESVARKFCLGVYGLR